MILILLFMIAISNGKQHSYRNQPKVPETGHELRIKNNCPFKVLAGLLNNPGKSLPANGGFSLHPGAIRSVNFEKSWAGRIWGRTGCDSSGRCETGDCGNKVECNGAGGVPPVTLAEITFDGHSDQDFYDISLVDGYNLAMRMKPLNSESKGAGCDRDLLQSCPPELSEVKNGRKVACFSACMKLNTDQFCCRGAYGTPDKCDPKKWPVNYAKIFKDSCPQAYSYAYDDASSTFTHRGHNTGYEITFCSG